MMKWRGPLFSILYLYPNVTLTELVSTIYINTADCVVAEQHASPSINHGTGKVGDGPNSVTLVTLSSGVVLDAGSTPTSTAIPSFPTPLTNSPIRTVSFTASGNPLYGHSTVSSATDDTSSVVDLSTSARSSPSSVTPV